MTVHVPKCHSTCGLNAAQYYFLLFLNFERISRIDGFANKPPDVELNQPAAPDSLGNLTPRPLEVLNPWPFNHYFMF
jgi:hypothetical protein